MLVLFVFWCRVVRRSTKQHGEKTKQHEQHKIKSYWKLKQMGHISIIGLYEIKGILSSFKANVPKYASKINTPSFKKTFLKLPTTVKEMFSCLCT
jgi:hypothetical protein